MRILQIATSYPTSETDPTAPFVRSIARALAANGHELQIIVPQRDEMPLTTHERGITVHWTRYAPFPALNAIGHGRSLQSDTRLRRVAFAALPLFLVAASLKAAAIVRQWKPAVIHSHWVLPGGLVGAAAAKALGIPHAVNLHGSDIFVANSRAAYRSVVRWVFRNTRHVIACSSYLAGQAILLGSDPARTHFLPHGVDSAIFEICKRLPAHTESPVVLAAGRLVEKKGFRILIEHADIFLNAHPCAQLWIAGEGDDRAVLEKVIAARPRAIGERIRLLGNVEWSRMPGLLSRASVFVMPSIRDSQGNQDGLPTVVLEAMSCGVAVVTSDIGGASALIEDGVSGFVVPAGDGVRLAAVITTLLADSELRDRIGSASGDLVRSKYSWSAVAQQMERILNA